LIAVLEALRHPTSTSQLTNAFSKKFEKHCHMVAIYHAYYNFCRVRQTLRVTPPWKSPSLYELGKDHWTEEFARMLGDMDITDLSS
jgi:hypothetical protein